MEKCEVMPEFQVNLRPAPGSDVPDALRLRKLLKRLGRSHGLRCTDVREVKRPPTEVKKVPG